VRRRWLIANRHDLHPVTYSASHHTSYQPTMTSVITNLFVSIAVLLKGISLAILDIFAALWHVVRDINLAIFHILGGIVGFLYSA
jgi:hypothetical protein